MIESILNDLPDLREFLISIPKKEHKNTIKQLLRIGLSILRSSLVVKQREEVKPPTTDEKYILQEVKRISNNVEELKRIVQRDPSPPTHSKGAVKQTTHPPQTIIQKQHSYQYQYNPDTNHLKANTTSYRHEQSSGKLQQKNEFHRNPHSVQQYNRPVLQNQPRQSTNTHPYSNSNAYYGEQQYNERYGRQQAQLNGGVLTQLLVNSRPHLNDENVRSVLNVPPSPPSEGRARRAKSKELLRPHMYQEELNREEQERLRMRGRRKENKRKRASKHKYRFVSSKIKQLIEGDRRRHLATATQRHFQDGFKKYEYSDSSIEEQSQEEEDHTHQHNVFSKSRNHQQYPSRDRSDNNKQYTVEGHISPQKQAEKNIKKESASPTYKESSKLKVVDKSSPEFSRFEQEQCRHEDDIISNSSSFSEFSMGGSRREPGKISRRKD